MGDGMGSGFGGLFSGGGGGSGFAPPNVANQQAAVALGYGPNGTAGYNQYGNWQSQGLTSTPGSFSRYAPAGTQFTASKSVLPQYNSTLTVLPVAPATYNPSLSGMRAYGGAPSFSAPSSYSGYSSPYGAVRGFSGPNAGEQATNWANSIDRSTSSTFQSTMQSNPYAQAYSGKIGGTISGTANPYNNGQFMQMAKPTTVFEALQQSWNSLFAPVKTLGGLAVQPGAKYGYSQNEGPTSKATATDIVGASNIARTLTPIARTVTPPSRPALSYEDTSMEALRNATTKGIEIIKANPSADLSKIDLGIQDIPDLEIAAASKFADERNLVILDYTVHTQSKMTTTAADGTVTNVPMIGNDKYNQLTDPGAKAYFHDNYNDPYMPDGEGIVFTDTALYQRGKDANYRLAIRGLPQQVEFAPLRTLNFAYADLLGSAKDNQGNWHSVFESKLLNDGYSPKFAGYYTNLAKQIMWGNTPENIAGDESLAERFGPTRGQPYMSITIPGVLETMSKAQQDTYVNNLAQATAETNRQMKVQGMTYVAGQTDAIIEQLALGNNQIVPEYDAKGDYTGGLGVMTREAGVAVEGGIRENTARSARGGELPPETPSPVDPQTSYVQFLSSSGWSDAVKQYFIKASVYKDILAKWGEEAPNTPFENWMQSFDWANYYNSHMSTGGGTTGRNYTRRSSGPTRRLRSVSY